MPTLDDLRHLARAFALGERGRGATRPNPAVGCVIVRDGAVVGEGWHERAGGPHAEDVALTTAGDRAEGATAYVTLEPCAHEGRTSPCAAALADAGVARVVIALSDPNPEASGGAAHLERRGVVVERDVAPRRGRELNEAFIHLHETGRPHVTLKLAQTLDGRAAAPDGTSRWITSVAARTAAHRLRAEVDAVLVGSGTVLADDPALTARLVEVRSGQPRPVALDGRGRTPAGARVVRRAGLIATTDRSDAAWRRSVTDGGAEVVTVAAGSGGRGVDPAAVLSALAGRDVQAVLLEGGPTVAAAFLRAGLVDRLVLHLGPCLLGSEAVASLAGLAIGSVADQQRWRAERVTRLGPDVEVRAVPDR